MDYSRLAVLARRAGFFVADVFVIALSLFSAFWLRFDGFPPSPYLSLFLAALPIAVAVKVPVLAIFRMYRFSWSHVGFDELYATLLACVGSSCRSHSACALWQASGVSWLRG